MCGQASTVSSSALLLHLWLPRLAWVEPNEHVVAIGQVYHVAAARQRASNLLGCLDTTQLNECRAHLCLRAYGWCLGSVNDADQHTMQERMQRPLLTTTIAC